ncbi:hypothetical protein [Streptomyces violaceolatus]|uniref:hypothetical protein n=1 Tax=Streptomyces violaceolatus TaxID=67378 RepID=UPI0031D00D6D
MFPLTAQREEQQAVRRATNLREEARVAADEEGRPEPFRYERLREVRRVPDREAYLLFTLFGIAVLGLRTFLASVDIASLGPSDAPAIMATVAGIPGLVIAVATLTPRWIRAWGAKAKDTGQGSGAAASGQADVIRAQKEGEAAVIRARAELMRAEAEYKRAEMGLEPLPPAQLPQPEQPLALPPARGNDSAPGGAPQLPPV